MVRVVNLETLEKHYSVKPCPFCGLSAEVLQKENGDFFIVCKNKSCTGYNVRTKSHHRLIDSVFAWNMRKGCCEQ